MTEHLFPIEGPAATGPSNSSGSLGLALSYVVSEDSAGGISAVGWCTSLVFLTVCYAEFLRLITLETILLLKSNEKTRIRDVYDHHSQNKMAAYPSSIKLIETMNGTPQGPQGYHLGFMLSHWSVHACEVQTSLDVLKGYRIRHVERSERHKLYEELVCIFS